MEQLVVNQSGKEMIIAGVLIEAINASLARDVSLWKGAVIVIHLHMDWSTVTNWTKKTKILP